MKGPAPPRLSLDHVGFVTAALEPLRAAWQRLGFSPTEPRELMAGQPGSSDYRSLQQQSCHVVLGSGYVELTAVSSTDPGHHLAAWRRLGPALQILAFGVEDPDGQAELCARQGLPATSPADASRRIEYGTRHGDARFRWFMIHAEASPEALVCYVRNETPQLVYQDAVTRHSNGARALVEVVVLLADGADPVAERRRWDRILGAAGRRVSAAGDWRWALAPRGAVFRVCTRAALRDRFGDAVVSDLGGGRAAALRIEVEDPIAVRALFERGGVPHESGPQGRLVVPPSATGGAILELSPP